MITIIQNHFNDCVINFTKLFYLLLLHLIESPSELLLIEMLAIYYTIFRTLYLLIDLLIDYQRTIIVVNYLES